MIKCVKLILKSSSCHDTKKMLTKNVDADVTKKQNKQMCYKEICEYKISQFSAFSSFLLHATSCIIILVSRNQYI
jgi:hypothetical protein